jgi:hypothetical protein
MNYKLTVRRRKASGELETATYRLEHLSGSGGDDEQLELLADLEFQANNSSFVLSDNRAQVTVLVEEID